MNKYLISTLSFVLSAQVLANHEQHQIDDRLNDQRVQTENTVVNPKIQGVPKVEQAKVAANTEKSVSITKEELVKQPDLVVRALLPAVIQGNADNVELLFPIYQKIPAQFHDPILTQWASAIVARKQDKYREAIHLYREILAAQSDILPARLQLAVSLFENNELEASEDQFKKLRAEKLVPEVQSIIEQYLAAISRKDRWTFGGGFTFLNDPNINNAPKAGTRYGNWTPPKSESAQGLGFNFNVGKKWSWGNGFFNELRLDTSGKYYWNNRKYNEVSGRGSLGIGFQNAKYTLTVLPFIDQTLYAGGSNGSTTLKRFSRTMGASTEFSYWLSPKWQLNSSYEYGEQRYAKRKHLNGNYHFVSTGLSYLASSKRYFFGNLNYNRTSTRDADDSFFRRGVTLGWGQEWGKGLSTRLSVSLAQKRYKGPMPIFGITQRNKEFGVQASVWHRAVHFWGITPRLTYNYAKTSSNHPFYSYDKHRVFMDFSKQF